MVVFSVGTAGWGSIGDFIAMLLDMSVGWVIDCRTSPWSHKPEYRGEALAGSLRDAGIGYAHWVALGGRPDGRKTGPEFDWTAGYDRPILQVSAMEERDEYVAHIERVINGAQAGHKIALLCACGKHETCHRGYVLTPSLVKRGVEVEHIYPEQLPF